MTFNEVWAITHGEANQSSVDGVAFSPQTAPPVSLEASVAFPNGDAAAMADETNRVTAVGGKYTGVYDADEAKKCTAELSRGIFGGLPPDGVILLLAQLAEVVTGDHIIMDIAVHYVQEMAEKKWA